MSDCVRLVVEVDVVNSSLSTDSQLMFPSQQQHQNVDDGEVSPWKRSLGYVRLSASNLINPAGKLQLQLFMEDHRIPCTAKHVSHVLKLAFNM